MSLTKFFLLKSVLTNRQGYIISGVSDPQLIGSKNRKVISEGYSDRKKTMIGFSGGFTIIELLIATLIFTVILLLISTGVIQFTRIYYKGVTESYTQGVARAIVDRLSQDVAFKTSSTNNVQLTTNNPNSEVGYCVGGERYSAALNKQLIEVSPNPLIHQVAHAFYLDTPAGGCGSGTKAQDLSNPSGRELLSPKTRLNMLDISSPGTSGVYTIKVRVIYGDDDLLCNANVTGDCASSAASTSLDSMGADIRCKGQSGSQFCAVSEITTSAQTRVQ